MSEVEQPETIPTLTFNGKEYNISDLTEEQRYLVSQIQDIESQLSPLRAKTHQLTRAKDGFVYDLEAALQQPTEE
tara:strand:- start:251 stop:475 length:225 start_codon:yes stop_codon:yes gene_type:complete